MLCGPQRPIGGACSVPNDCQTGTCDGLCEPAICDCTHNPNTTCATQDVCSGGDCILSSLDPENDCALQTCGPALGANCTDCIPPQCNGESFWNAGLCSCTADTSPIIIDTDGSGFHLTSAANGVQFDFYGDGNPIQVAWTAAGSTNGWLALDRNGNGVIDSAKELFGNITDQPPSSNPNGFLALAVFDLPENGGNGDGIIDSQDAVWPKLLVWIDSNHDGISQPAELHPLDAVGIHSISLKYTESLRVDAYGNEFRYRGTLNPVKPDTVNRVIYDVILTTANSAGGAADQVLRGRQPLALRLKLQPLPIAWR